MPKLLLALLAVAALGAHVAGAQTLTTIFRFDGADGAATIWTPVSDGQGNLYGTTGTGGPYSSRSNPSGLGTIYEFTPGVSRNFETLHNFAGGTDGAFPSAGPTYDKYSGLLYGTTVSGGVTNATCTQGCGTIFSLNTATGVYTTLYAFTGVADEDIPLLP